METTHSASERWGLRDMIVCKACGRPVAANATACPNCGAPPPAAAFANSCLGTALGMVVFLGLCLVVAYLLGYF
jgi:uncharacterized OB-fold protein